MSLKLLTAIICISFSTHYVQCNLYGAEYGHFKAELCPGDSLKLTWAGVHNILETKNADCSSDVLGSVLEDYYDLGYNYTFQAEDLMSETPGETRYFKCGNHCAESENRFEITHGTTCNTPAPTVSDIVCIYEDERVLLENGTYGRLSFIRKGDVLKRSDGQMTTVRRTIKRTHRGNVSYVMQKGVCGGQREAKITPNHAIRCASDLLSVRIGGKDHTLKWWHVADIGLRIEHPILDTVYVNLQTDDYCTDDMILESGFVVETWDGRAVSDNRPHYYTSDGERVNCR
eukprot:gene2619-3380_t